MIHIKQLFYLVLKLSIALQDCNEKVNSLDPNGSQVVNLTTNNSRAGCHLVPSETNSLVMSCRGSARILLLNLI